MPAFDWSRQSRDGWKISKSLSDIQNKLPDTSEYNLGDGQPQVISTTLSRKNLFFLLFGLQQAVNVHLPGLEATSRNNGNFSLLGASDMASILLESIFLGVHFQRGGSLVADVLSLRNRHFRQLRHEGVRLGRAGHMKSDILYNSGGGL
jgi:hypothetical protein